MGIPIQTPMGATGGAGIFTAIDNSVELGAQAAALQEIALALSTMVVANETKYWGTAALAVPGSPAASMANIASMLADVNTTMISIKNQQAEILEATKGLASAVQQQTQTMNTMATMQSMAVADQIKTNAHDRAETVAALARNGIEPQPEPDVKERMKEVLRNSTEMYGLSEFSAWTNNMVDKLLTELTDYIKKTAPYIYASDALSAVGTKIKSVLADLGDFISTNAADLGKQARALAAKTGIWTPSA